jgi:hypothetical protein
MTGSSIGFLGGNIDQWAAMLQTHTPKIASLLFKTIDPLICASLIDLLGSSGRFKKKEAIIAPTMQGKQVSNFKVRFIYSVPDFIGYTGSDEPIVKDRNYILKRLQQIPGIAWPDTAVSIQPKNGSITVTFTVPVGYL